MIDVYENDINFQHIKKISNLNSLKEFQNLMEKKITSMAKVIEICPALGEKFEIAILNIRPVLKNNQESFETKLVKYSRAN